MTTFRSQTLPPGPEQFADPDGLYNMPHIGGDTPSARDANWSILLEEWIDRAWVTPYESPESAVRLSEKLREETDECIEAYDAYRTSGSAEDRHHFLEEAGDLVWVNLAAAHNLGATVYAELELFGGIQRGPYQPEAASDEVQETPYVAPPYDNLGALWNQGYRSDLPSLVPSYSAFSPPELTNVPLDGIERLKYNAEVIAKATQYIWNTEKGPLDRERMHWFSLVYVTPVVADSLLEVGDMVKSAGATLQDVLEILIPKIEGRIALNAVDKVASGRQRVSNRQNTIDKSANVC